MNLAPGNLSARREERSHAQSEREIMPTSRCKIGLTLKE